MASQLLVAWLACPLLLLVLSTGIGLGVRALARHQLPGGVVPIAGLAVAVAVGTVLAKLAAGLILPTLIVLSVAGALAGARRLSAPSFWAVAVGVVAFVLYAAPIVLSGEATFAGYIKLDDTATWLAFTDRIMDGESGTAGLAPSSYEATLAVNLANGYPVGALVPLAFAGEALATDPAWLFQPYLALLGVMLALCLWEIARRAVPALPLRALVAVAAALPALLVGFYLWGGLKEMFVAAAAAGVAAQAAWFETSGRDPRALLGVLIIK